MSGKAPGRMSWIARRLRRFWDRELPGGRNSWRLELGSASLARPDMVAVRAGRREDLGEDLEEVINILARVRRTKREAEAGLIAGDGGITNGGQEDAVLTELVGGAYGMRFRTEQDGEDRAVSAWGLRDGGID